MLILHQVCLFFLCVFFLPKKECYLYNQQISHGDKTLAPLWMDDQLCCPSFSEIMIQTLNLTVAHCSQKNPIVQSVPAVEKPDYVGAYYYKLLQLAFNIGFGCVIDWQLGVLWYNWKCTWSGSQVILYLLRTPPDILHGIVAFPTNLQCL